MSAEFYIDIREPDGTRVGSGPIVTADGWQSTRRMDRAGTFTFALPANDPKASDLVLKRRATCYRFGPNGPEFVGGGIIDNITTRPRRDGSVVLQVSGNDMLRELMRRTVGFLKLRVTHFVIDHDDGLAFIAAFAPPGWTFIPAVGGGNVYYQFSGASVLNALSTLAELTDTHFYLSGEREVTFQLNFSDSGLRAVEAPLILDDEPDGFCVIRDLMIADESYDRISRIYPYGNGQKEKALTMATSNRTAPAGYALDKVNNYLRHIATETDYDRDERHIQWFEIAPGDYNDDNVSTAQEVTSAANQLFDRALYELQRRINPTQSYQLGLMFCPLALRPLQSIRCIFRRSAEGRNLIRVDAQLNILETTVTVDGAGLQTTGLTVATNDRWPESDASPIVRLVQDRMYQGA